MAVPIVAGRPPVGLPGTRAVVPTVVARGAKIQRFPFAGDASMAFNEFRMDNQWLPFTPNRSFQKDPRIFVAADGMHFTTHDGKQVIDGISSLWCVGAGHNRQPINEAIKKQLDTLDYATAFSVSNDKAFRAAEMIAAMAPGDLNKVLFCNSGSEAADTSLKVALAYHRSRGEGHRNLFIGRERGYHGVNFGGMSVGGIPANRKMYGSALLPRVDHLRFIHDPVNHAYIHNQEPVWSEDLLLELENRILPLHDPSNVAAVIVEPVAGSAGWYIPPQGYLKRLREICDKHGILLIFDEVITGFGRLGTPFASDYYGVQPDMLNFAKAITNGVIPLGGVVCTDRIYDAMMGAHGSAPEHAIEFFHGYTYSGHPVACAAAIATLDLFREEKLFERAGEMAPVGDAMHSALKGLPNVISIRSLGLAAAVELSSIPGLPGKRAFDIFMDCYKRGVLVRNAGENLVFAPPFIVEKSHIDTMVNVLADAIQSNA
jgi:beta-alanine--pyruvate transaminase